MNYNDIKKFPHSNYQIDVAWNYLQDQMDMLSDGIDLDLNPVYQRGYKWEGSQKIAYLEYILRGGFSGRDIFWNSANWQGNMSHVGTLELVDGQQRVKTVLAFLDNKVPIFGGNYYKDIEGRLRQTDARFKFHINNLATQLEVVEWYIGLNTGGSVHTEEDLRVAFDYKESLKNNYAINIIRRKI